MGLGLVLIIVIISFPRTHKILLCTQATLSLTEKPEETPADKKVERKFGF